MRATALARIGLAGPSRHQLVQGGLLAFAPALSAQGYDETALVQAVAEACRKGGGDAPIPVETRKALQTVSKVLNIGWIGDALVHEATTICSRSNHCPRPANACH